MFTSFYKSFSINMLLNNNIVLYSGKLIKHDKRAIGVLRSKFSDTSFFDDGTEVLTESLQIHYPELEEFRNSKSKFYVLEELSKYGERNDLKLHKFNSKIELDNFVKEFNSLKCRANGKWSSTIYFKNGKTIKINLDL